RSMSTWVGMGPVIGPGSLDGFAVGVMMSGAVFLTLTAPRRGAPPAGCGGRQHWHADGRARLAVPAPQGAQDSQAPRVAQGLRDSEAVGGLRAPRGVRGQGTRRRRIR